MIGVTNNKNDPVIKNIKRFSPAKFQKPAFDGKIKYTIALVSININPLIK